MKGLFVQTPPRAAQIALPPCAAVPVKTFQHQQRTVARGAEEVAEGRERERLVVGKISAHERAGAHVDLAVQAEPRRKRDQLAAGEQTLEHTLRLGAVLCVKAGEHGIQILAPCPKRKWMDHDKIDPATGLPVKDENENMAKAVERWTMDLSVQLQKRFRFGVSPVQSGAENLHPAYRKVMQSAALVEEKESGRSQDICLNTLIRQNLHMSELVYMEHYNSAFACFKEMADTLYQQKRRRLRNQQLSGLMSLTLCMLMETSSENSALLQEAGIDIGALTQPEDDEAELLAEWEKVFGLLEAHQDKRIRGQYSEQFASIYQYMHAHFRDSGLSLTALAEEFGMSVSTLSREFQKNLGQGFLDSLHQMRIEEAKYAIENTNASLNDIAISVGYTNTLTMTRAFKKYLGCTPGSFRKKEDIS